MAALGDGIVWNEALPDDTTVANTIDDHNRDLRIGVRARMALEHVWPTAHTGTGSGGRHTYLTFQAQAAAPTMAGTTVGGLYVTTEAQGALIFVGSDGTETTIINTAGGVGTGTDAGVNVIATGTLGSIAICSSASPTTLIALTGSADGLPLICHTATAAAAWGKLNITNAAVVTGSAGYHYAAATATAASIVIMGTMKYAWGICPFSGDGSSQIDGLPFANTTSYSFVVCQSGNSYAANAPGASQIDGATVLIHNGNGARNVSWVGCGT